MKFVIFIQSIIILALSIIPCDDVNASMLKANSRTEIHADDAGKHNETNDNCSPFCTCTCCSVAAANVVTLNQLADFSPIISKLTYANQGPAINPGISIWQPPKLA